MFGLVRLASKSIEDYRSIAGDQEIDELLRIAENLKGARVLHLSITEFGTGVAELLRTIVPLMNALGLNSQWQVVRSTDEFANVNRAMYNALGGVYTPWTREMSDIWLKYNEANAALFDEEYDFVIVHDPQAAALLSFILEQEKRKPRGKWVWHCHMDVSDAQSDVWHLLGSRVEPYDQLIFDVEDYVPPGLSEPVSFVPPAIDPLCPKNMDLPEQTVRTVLHQYGLDLTRPVVCQISPFDQWHDPVGLIEAYQAVKGDLPGLQLVLIASMVSEDPEVRAYYQHATHYAEQDRDLFVLSSLNNVGNVEMNAFQRASAVVVQKSLRKGFALWISEAMWKGRPVVAANRGGIPRQVIEGRTGYLIERTEECAQRILHLLNHPEVAERMGSEGKKHVGHNFLITRWLRDYLNLLAGL